MSTKKNIIAGMVIIIAVLFSSCTEKIDLKLGSTYVRLSVDGAISTDTAIQVVKLTKSTDYYYDQPAPVVSGATVTISDGTNVYQLKENQMQKGTYETTTKVYGIAGNTYTLSIKNVDVNKDEVMEEYTAQSELRPVIPADSIEITRYRQPGAKDTGWVVKAYAKNVPGEAWLLFKVRKNHTNLSDSAHKLTYVAYSDGSQPYINGSAVFVSDGTRQQEKIEDGDTITLEAFGITKAYYQFLIDFVEEYYPKMPIGSGPSANISTNIEPKGKAVGFFPAYSVQRISRVYHANKR